MPALFIPGWGARASIYRDALPPGWEVLQPPSFRATGGAIEAYPAWLADELARRTGPITLGGHSFGAALAVLAAVRGDADVERLVLVDPAGLPLSKPKSRALRDFGRQLVTGVYPVAPALASVGTALVAPRAALRLARSVYALDLSRELAELRGIPCTVLAADSDTLTPPEHCRRVAELSGATFEQFAVRGDHVWFLVAGRLLRQHAVVSADRIALSTDA
jgi:pimeloyl-ACP methyl ester carboxylesterase